MDKDRRKIIGGILSAGALLAAEGCCPHVRAAWREAREARAREQAQARAEAEEARQREENLTLAPRVRERFYELSSVFRSDIDLHHLPQNSLHNAAHTIGLMTQLLVRHRELDPDSDENDRMEIAIYDRAVPLCYANHRRRDDFTPARFYILGNALSEVPNHIERAGHPPETSCFERQGMVRSCHWNPRHDELAEIRTRRARRETMLDDGYGPSRARRHADAYREILDVYNSLDTNIEALNVARNFIWDGSQTELRRTRLAAEEDDPEVALSRQMSASGFVGSSECNGHYLTDLASLIGETHAIYVCRR